MHHLKFGQLLLCVTIILIKNVYCNTSIRFFIECFYQLLFNLQVLDLQESF